MKLNKPLLVLVLSLLTAFAVGCSSGGTSATEKATQESSTTASESEKITMPEERPTMIGKVKEIVGNEVTVYIAQVPEKQETPKETSDQTQAQTQDKPQKQPNNGAMPEGRGFNMQFTDQTETFSIPVGTPIVTMQRGAAEVKQVELTEIKTDTILQVWKKDDTVYFVQVAGGREGNKQDTGTKAGNGAEGGPQGGPPPGM